jgi:hypothetical protein
VKKEQNNLMIYLVIAFFFICTLSLLISYLTFNQALQTRTVNVNDRPNQVLIPSENNRTDVQNRMAESQNKVNETENSNLNSPVTEQPSAVDNIQPNPVSPEVQKKVEGQLLQAKELIKNKDIDGAINILQQIAEENKGTDIETNANNTIYALKNPEQAMVNNQNNDELGKLRQVQACLSNNIATQGNFPDIAQIDKARNYLQETCGLTDKEFIYNDLQNITVIDNSANFNVSVEVKSGKKYFLTLQGIQ